MRRDAQSFSTAVNHFWIAYHAVVVALLLLSLAMLAINLTGFPAMKLPKKSAKMDADAPLISVLVPARNEERRIGACAGSLLAQDYPNYELLVLDDRSDDATAEILEQLGISESGGKIGRRLSGTELPAGWTGKNWACHQLSQQARGEWLLFTDADTTHAPQTLTAAIALARKTHADLLSAWPLLVTKTWSEKVVITVLHLLGVVNFPHALVAWLQRDPARARRVPPQIRRALGGANGQFILFRKSSYDAIGGHAAVRHHLVEDVALGREVALRMGEGMRVVNCDGGRFLTVRMYENFREVWEGFTKNAWAAFENALGIWWTLGIGQLCIFLLPFVFVCFPSQRKPALIEIALIYLLRIILAVRFRTSWLGVWLHPLGQALAMAIALNSWWHSTRGGVTWKGRVYRTE